MNLLGSVSDTVLATPFSYAGFESVFESGIELNW